MQHHHGKIAGLGGDYHASFDWHLSAAKGTRLPLIRHPYDCIALYQVPSEGKKSVAVRLAISIYASSA